MNLLQNILYKKKILKLTTKKVEKWGKKKDITNLEYALLNGIFYIRQAAARELGNLKSKESLPILIEKMDDQIKIVSIASMDAIEMIGLSNALEVLIKNKKDYWTEQSKLEKKRAKLRNLNRADEIPKWERPSSKTLQNVKEMLRKPMNVGKWINLN